MVYCIEFHIGLSHGVVRFTSKGERKEYRDALVEKLLSNSFGVKTSEDGRVYYVLGSKNDDLVCEFGPTCYEEQRMDEAFNQDYTNLGMSFLMSDILTEDFIINNTNFR